MSFLHPGLLIGAALLAVPLIIHLLNRQRFRKREWAAMEFLLAAYRKQRRRLRNENLLLLLLRCLLPVLLALAIARPVLQSSLEVVGFGGRTHHVMVIDGSYSMGVTPGGSSSPFRRAKDLAVQAIDGIREGRGHTITVVLAGTRPKVLIRETTDRNRAKDMVLGLERPEDSGAELLPTITEIAGLLEETEDPEAEPRVLVFTDLQLRGIGLDRVASSDGAAQDGGSAAADQRASPPTAGTEAQPGDGSQAAAGDSPGDLFADTLGDALDRIRELGGVALVDVGPGEGSRLDNLQVVDFRASRAAAVVGLPTLLQVDVQNRSLAGRTVQVTLEVDGAEPQREQINVPAVGRAQVEFAVMFREPGARVLTASLEGDDLAVDDQRFLVLQVRDRLRFLFVEGRPEEDLWLREATTVRSMLDPAMDDGDNDLTPFTTEVVDELRFLAGQAPLSDYDAVVLCNLERVNQRAAERLEEALLAGTGVWIQLGDRTDPAAFDLHLHKAGLGLLPIRLDEPTGYRVGGDQSFTPRLTAPEHPLFRELDQELYIEVLQSLPVYRMLPPEQSSLEAALAATGDAAEAPEPDDSEGAEDDGDTTPRGPTDFAVLAELTDARRSPLITANRFGNGRVLLTTSAISLRPDRWNRLDLPMIAIPWMHGIAEWLALPATDPFNNQVGSVLTCSLGDQPRDVAITLPERAGGGKAPVGSNSKPLPGGRHTLPVWARTEYAGVYVFDLAVEGDTGRAPLELPFAVNPDPAEGALTYASHSAVASTLGLEQVFTVLPSGGDTGGGDGRGDLGPFLLYGVLALLIGEAAMARFVSRRRGG